jgi:cell fate regulator YaaT (PSP1 superfamily)
MTSLIDKHTTVNPQDYVLRVSFMKVGKQYYFNFDNHPDLTVGDRVIVTTRKLGEQMGEIKGFTPRDEADDINYIHHIDRPATPADLLSEQQWRDRELPALIECREKAADLGGYDEIKFVAAEYNYNGTILTFMFTTVDDQDSRINTNRLRNALQKQFDARVEVRQVGAREVAKLQGGFGACGIPRCCSTFLTEFSSISINMAKAQGITLNPSEITGMCGRLRCCLKYEYEQYVEARKQLPRVRKRIGTPHGEGRVIDVHPIQDAVTVQIDDQRFFVKREELIPLSEYEALKKAAASPCGKNESGGCDCGSHRPKESAEEIIEQADEEVKNESKRRSSKKRRPRGKRNNRNKD